jgi:c-di-GMP-binding flagellar brake protein YcgR
MSEKRKFLRVPLNSILFFRVETQTADSPLPLIRTQTPLSVDLSEGGMKFLAIQELPMGVILRILLVFQGTKYPIELEGKVVWTEKDASSENWYCGVEFFGLSESKSALLKRYVSHA